MIKLAFDAVPLLSPLTGIGQYALHLALALESAQEVDAKYFYGAYWSDSVLKATPQRVGSALSWVRANVPFSYQIRQWVQRNRFAGLASQGHFDLYHAPNNTALPFDGPSVITVHDLSWIRYPEMHPIERVRAMDKHFEPGLRRASCIITDSAFVKQELMDVFGVSPDRVHPVALGVEPLFCPLTVGQTQTVLQAHGLTHGNYWLAVGTLEPRKNLQLALRAFMQLAKAERQACPLILVGMKGWKTGLLEQQLQPLIAAGEVRQLGYVSREDLAVIMAGAKALIYPSIYEGFGLPPLEAMACGVPVIVSNVSSLPEVVGDAGILVDPQDADGLAMHMRQLLADNSLCAALGQKAQARSLQFSWAQCAQDTIDVYKAALT